MNTVVAAVVVLYCVGSATAQVAFPGSCPDLDVIQAFDVGRYLGKWFEIEKYFASFQREGICVTATYTDIGNATVGVLNRMIIESTGEERVIEGYAKLVDPNGGGKLEVTFPFPRNAREGNYWVMDTDYDTYSLVWSCLNVGPLNFQNLWYLAREQFPSEEIRTKIIDTMTALGLDTEKLLKTDQTNCDTARS